MKRNAFTLLELIVVLGIIGILGAMFFPAVQRARAAARDAVCKNNVDQINKAFTQYAELAGLPRANPKRLVAGWTIEILPYLDQQNLKNSLPKDRPLAELSNEHYRQPSILRCPTQENSRRTSTETVSSAHYVMITNNHRNTAIIIDAPTTLSSPWATSPEWEVQTMAKIDEPGPHNGGYNYAQGFQQGVRYFHPN